MPWTADSHNLNLFEVAAWFPEAVRGLFLMLALKTRIACFLIMCTMLVALFMQKMEPKLMVYATSNGISLGSNL